MLVVLDGRPEWLALAAGGYLGAESHLGRWREVPHAEVVGYGLATLFVAAVSLLRWQIGRHPDWAARYRPWTLRGPEESAPPAVAATAPGPDRSRLGKPSYQLVTGPSQRHQDHLPPGTLGT
jgi:hypothetical protein